MHTELERFGLVNGTTVTRGYLNPYASNEDFLTSNYEDIRPTGSPVYRDTDPGGTYVHNQRYLSS